MYLQNAGAKMHKQDLHSSEFGEPAYESETGTGWGEMGTAQGCAAHQAKAEGLRVKVPWGVLGVHRT